jgi:hypothetical protein
VRIKLSDETLEVRLARWEKIVGLMGDIRVARADISEARVVENPVREAMGTGIKAGLRIPWVLYIARTLRLDQAFIVRRRMPGLAFAVANHAPLERVLVSTPDAEELARKLSNE